MITAIIVDDEAKGRLSLRKKLQSYCPEVTVLAEAVDGADALQAIDKFMPELVFLDIEMPKMNGFEMLNAIKDKKFQVIFTTAYDQYAIKAIKYAAFDYLLKPVDIDELRLAIAKIGSSVSQQANTQFDLLQQNMEQPKRLLHKLAIPTMDGLMFYNLSDIIYLEANSNYTNLFMVNNGKVIASKTLKEFEELLPADTFFRTHHSFIINLNYIKRYIKGDGGQIELQNGQYVEVSRRKKEEFLKAIGQ